MLRLLEHPLIRPVKEHWLTIAFVLGFCTDLILLNKIDDLFDNLILLFYTVLSTLSFLIFYLAVAEKFPANISLFLKKYSPVLMQYAFGGLLSGMLIFYGRSGDWLASAPFLLLIVSVILGNEFVQKNSNRLIYHITLYFIGVYAYIVLVVPVILGRMGDLVFILSGLIALAIVSTVVQLLYKIVPNFMRVNTRSVIVTIGFIYIGFNTLYFTSIIPPIPLSLAKLEVVHDVSRTSTGAYRVVSESQPWYREWLPWNPVIHPSQSYIACYASVYAPTRLSTDIYHRWEFKNEQGKWVERFRLGYAVSHSASAGYRGYTQISSFSEGEWRCSVETERGQVLGRETFIISRDARARRELVTTIE